MPKSSKSSSALEKRNDRCFNPFNLRCHRKRERLRKVSKHQLVVLNIPVTDELLKKRICNICRLKVSELQKDRENKNEEINDSDFDAVESDDVNMERFPASLDVSLEDDNVAVSAAIDLINQGLNMIGVSPIHRRKVSQQHLTAEWHFFPTSHGKGACDGLGGTHKRLAARASLQRISNPIQTPKQLFEWATESLPNISSKYVTNKEYDEEERKLEARFKRAITVKGTLKFHCIIPIVKNYVRAKYFSLEDERYAIEFKVMK